MSKFEGGVLRDFRVLTDSASVTVYAAEDLASELKGMNADIAV